MTAAGLRHRAAWCACAAWAVLALAACTSVPQASRERDAEAKQFITHPNAAAIYVYRPDFPSGDSEWTDSVLWADEHLVGTTLPGSYFRLDLRAGTHVLRGGEVDLGRFTLDTRSGELYFVRLNVFGSTSHFALIPPETGKREILRCCERMENWAPGQRPLLR